MTSAVEDGTAVTAESAGPIVLAGPPRSIRGRVSLRNASDRDAVVRNVALRDTDGSATLLASSQRIGRRVVPSNAATTVPVRMRLDPATPPGEYNMELAVGDTTMAAVVHVTERVSLRLSPSRLVLDHGTSPVTRTVVAENRSNVPLTFTDPGAVVIDDELLICRILRAASHGLDDVERPTLDDIIAELAKQSGRILAQLKPLRVRIANGPVVVPPMSSAPLHFSIELPEGLDHHTRYVGIFPFYTATLEFIIAPGSNGN